MTKLAYSIKQACAAIGIGRTMLYKEITAGKILPRKIGKRTVILADDLANYVKTLPIARFR